MIRVACRAIASNPLTASVVFRALALYGHGTKIMLLPFSCVVHYIRLFSI